MKRASIWLIIFLSFCGLANSAYLTESEATGTPLLCNINGLSGCNVVAASPYSHIFGISLAQYGLAFYGLLFVLCAVELIAYRKPLRRLIQWIAAFGILASVVFVVLQVFVINALCVYCMASALLAALIFLFAALIEPVRSGEVATAPPRPPLTMPPAA